jgi:septum formation protein
VTLLLQAATPRLVLASASVARHAVLAGAGLVFTARASAVDEDTIKNSARLAAMPAAETALTLARAKAERIAAEDPDAMVIGADQMLVATIDGEERWFDKPPDLDGARGHLRALRGREHRLVTAILCWRHGCCAWQHVAEPRLRMRNVSDRFIEAYLAAEGQRVLTSVGAYRLEGPGVQLFDTVEGEHAAVLGVPLLALLGFLREEAILLR